MEDETHKMTLEELNKLYHQHPQCVEVEEQSSTPKQKADIIASPSHYAWLKDEVGVEPIDIACHLDFCLGSALKYILRAGRKKQAGLTDKEKAVNDIGKAIYYLNYYINNYDKINDNESKI